MLVRLYEEMMYSTLESIHPLFLGVFRISPYLCAIESKIGFMAVNVKGISNSFGTLGTTAYTRAMTRVQKGLDDYKVVFLIKKMIVF